MNTPINPDPARHYVIRCYTSDFKSVYFYEFRLPQDVENTCESATHYFYNQLNLEACGDSAYPWSMHTKLTPIGGLV